MNRISESGTLLLGIKKPVFSAPIEGVRGGVTDALAGEIILPVSAFKKQDNGETEKLDELVKDALHQAKRDPIWYNVKLVLLISKPPSKIDNVIPGGKEISELYKNSLDTTIIPKAFKSDGTVIYMIPASIDIAENGGDEITKLSLQD